MGCGGASGTRACPSRRTRHRRPEAAAGAPSSWTCAPRTWSANEDRSMRSSLAFGVTLVRSNWHDEYRMEDPTGWLASCLHEDGTARGFACRRQGARTTMPSNNCFSSRQAQFELKTPYTRPKTSNALKNGQPTNCTNHPTPAGAQENF